MFIGLLVGIFIGLVNGMFIGLVIGMFIGLINGLVIEPPSFPELLAADAARRVVAAVRRPRRTAQTVSVTSGVYPGRGEGRKRESIICYCGPGQDPGPSITVRAISRAAPTGITALMTPARVSAGPRANSSEREARAGDARQPAAASRPRHATDWLLARAQHGRLNPR